MRTGGDFGQRGRAASDRQDDPARHNPGGSPGALAVVGLGPGGLEHLTIRAREVLAGAEVIIGYKTYLDLILPLIEEQELVVSGMRREVDRARQAVEMALSGRKVAVVSSGDPGIYGMAGVILEVLDGREVPLEVVPGVTAATAAAAVAGAPLMHDNALISLSNLLTPWEVIAKRLDLAAAADFVLTLYNPKSKGRPHLIHQAREIILRHRAAVTPVAVVQNALRPGQKLFLATLADFSELEIDMSTVVIIGNSQSYVRDGRLITPRGYKL